MSRKSTNNKKWPKGSNLKSNLNSLPELMSEELAQQLQFNEDTGLNLNMFKPDGTCDLVDPHQKSSKSRNSSKVNQSPTSYLIVERNLNKSTNWDSVEQPMCKCAYGSSSNFVTKICTGFRSNSNGI